MKKTIKITISGSIFHLDEDAYHKLNTYLDKVHRYFNEKESGNEIINDIELRIAELFQLKITENKQVISLEDVDEIIQQLGHVEDFNEEEAADEEKTTPKKLFRDPDSAIFGGVAGGLGAYFSIDPVWIRLIFVLLLFGYGVIAIIYIILWMILPKAETYAQKLEMKGESISISTIEKKVRDEYEEVRSNLKNMEQSNGYKNFTRGLNKIFRFIGELIKGLFRFVSGLIGVALIIAGIGISLYAAGILFTDMPANWFYLSEFGQLPWMGMANSLFDPLISFTLISALSLIVLIPLILIIYLLFRAFGYKGKDKVVYGIGTTLWTMSVIVLIAVSLMQVWEFSTDVSKNYVEPLNIPEGQTLTLKLADQPQPEYIVNKSSLFPDFAEVYGIDNSGQIYMKPEINIAQSETDDYQLILKKSARGKNAFEASDRIKEIHYNWKYNTSTLEMPPYFTLANQEQFRMQELLITLKVPQGGTIYIPEQIEQYLDEADNKEGFWTDEMGNKSWKMDEHKLELLKNDKKQQ